MNNILCLFHHIHHVDDRHEVHHCGGDHPDASYSIDHCGCGLHRIDRPTATGHDFLKNEITVRFHEKCPEGGWHVESGA